MLHSLASQPPTTAPASQYLSTLTTSLSLGQLSRQSQHANSSVSRSIDIPGLLPPAHLPSAVLPVTRAHFRRAQIHHELLHSPTPPKHTFRPPRCHPQPRIACRDNSPPRCSRFQEQSLTSPTTSTIILILLRNARRGPTSWASRVPRAPLAARLLNHSVARRISRIFSTPHTLRDRERGPHRLNVADHNSTQSGSQSRKRRAESKLRQLRLRPEVF